MTGHSSFGCFTAGLILFETFQGIPTFSFHIEAVKFRIVGTRKKTCRVKTRTLSQIELPRDETPTHSESSKKL